MSMRIPSERSIFFFRLKLSDYQKYIYMDVVPRNNRSTPALISLPFHFHRHNRAVKLDGINQEKTIRDGPKPLLTIAPAHTVAVGNYQNPTPFVTVTLFKPHHND
jgi:hypothetical protein